MKRAKKLSIFVLCGILLFLTACASGKPAIELTSVKMANQVLNIDYTANDKVSKDDCKLKISVSQNSEDVSGTVYCFANLVDKDLEKGSKYRGLFRIATGRSWTVDGSLSVNGADVADTFETEDILSVFGEGAVVTVSFLINDEIVSERTLELEERNKDT